MRILRVLTRPNLGGPMRQAIALWHAQRELGHRSLLLVGACAADEASFDLSKLDIPRLEPSDIHAGTAGIMQVTDLCRAPAPLRDRRAAQQLGRAIAAFAPEVVHTHTSKAGWLGRRMAWRAKVPVIAHSFHGHVLRDYFSSPLSWLLAQRERRYAKTTDLLFAVSESCRQELSDLRISERIETLMPAIDCRPFRERDRQGARELLDLSDQQTVLGFVGRLVAVKAPHSFLDLLARTPGALGLVFGAGPLEAELRRHGAASRVRWMGAIPDLGRFLPAIDALIMPSLREGFPLAGVEAAAAGVATIGFDVPGVSDLVRALGCGSLVPRRQGIDGMVTALRALLEQEPATRIGDRAEPLITACQPMALARALEDRYQQVLDRAGPHSLP